MLRDDDSMRLSVELSDDWYRHLMLKADEEGMPVHDLMLRAIKKELDRTSGDTGRSEVSANLSAKPEP
jgi:hypothetical protein